MNAHLCCKMMKGTCDREGRGMCEYGIYESIALSVSVNHANAHLCCKMQKCEYDACGSMMRDDDIRWR